MRKIVLTAMLGALAAVSFAEVASAAAVVTSRTAVRPSVVGSVSCSVSPVRGARNTRCPLVTN